MKPIQAIRHDPRCDCWSRLGRTLFCAVVIACGPWFATEASADLYRVIYDYHTNRNDGIAYSNLFTTFPRVYTFGRTEGQPTRGPNPVPGPAFGSTAVDDLYNIVPVIHQYYQDKFGRNGPNGFGGIGDGIVRPKNYYSIFANSPNTTAIGWANGWSLTFEIGRAVPDIIGHEAFHIVQRSEGLAHGDGNTPDDSYSNPSLAEHGILMEGMSDFFGESFELYATGSVDWLSGGTSAGGPVRSLSDPPSLLDQLGRIPPDHLLSLDFRAPLNGNNFSHLNDGVINKASYLAVEGGFFNGIQVEGLGFDKVEQIWYRAITEYFTPNETFAMAYDHFLLSANDLYGPADAAKLQQALRAVELNGVAVPEPSSMALSVIGIVGLVSVFYRRRQAQAA